MFEIGEGVMHPVHGAGVIRDISCESLIDEPSDYYLIEMVADDIKLFVPVENAKDIGVREVVDLAEAKRLLAVVSGAAESLPRNYRERNRVLSSVLSGEDTMRKAEALRDLSWRGWEQSLSGADSRVFERLRQLLGGEISLALGMGFDEALVLLEEAMERSISETRRRGTDE